MTSTEPIHMGSSPRMRGAPGSGHVGCCKAGIIPADAGSTRLSTAYCAASGDHPRGCGEHSSSEAGT